MRIGLIEDGEAICRMTVAEKHLRGKAIVHGGAFASLLDCALGAASMSMAPEGHDSITMQLNVHFLRTARVGEELTATARALHAGRRTCVTEAQITDAEGKRVASATSTLMFLHIDGA